ncbi:60S ribosome subunit biogenesis protein NIP7 homolog [Galendromus occidentalis]|uniref:60S ribosome subunit biogenesis protein NIP7 homolog n=1 Tax=Galendromus occidentalis TaxID=34638 RepID=A0AAJ6QQK2_9ACAR|nr:60S ribosome subunit biogenesis protein NIP7 homolog [Galendromus occidentalis]
MRPLTDDETKAVLGKVDKFIGSSVKLLVDREDGTYCFRIQKDRVFYISEKVLKVACNVPRAQLLMMGVCFGKFTKTGKFRLQVTALDQIAPYAKAKIWLKPSAEQQFLYGHNVLKGGVSRLSENVEKYQGIIVYNMNDVPIGFGVAAKSTQECRNADPMTIVVFHQADVGEYLRCEDSLL